MIWRLENKGGPCLEGVAGRSHPNSEEIIVVRGSGNLAGIFILERPDRENIGKPDFDPIAEWDAMDEPIESSSVVHELTTAELGEAIVMLSLLHTYGPMDDGKEVEL